MVAYPDAIWDGDSENRDSDYAPYKAPNADDWIRMVAEVAATQTDLDTEKSNVDQLQVDVAALAGSSLEEFINDEGSAVVIAQPVYISEAGKIKEAQADSAASSNVVGLSTAVTTANGDNLTVRGQGEFTATAGQWDVVASTTGGLTEGAIYYLDPAASGKLTETRPTTSGHIVVEIGLALSATVLSIRINIIETTTTEMRNDVDALEAGYPVEINSAGTVAAPNELAASESRTVITNEATLSEKNSHVLPTAAEGVTFTFICRDTDGIRIVANTDDTIRISAEVTKTAGYVEATAVGAAVKLIAINAVEWLAINVIGTWTVETS